MFTKAMEINKVKDVATALEYKNTRDAIITNVREKNRTTFDTIQKWGSSGTTPTIVNRPRETQ